MVFSNRIWRISALNIPLTQLRKGCYTHAVWWYLITRSGKWSLKKYSPVSFLCDLCHSIYHKVVFRSDIFIPDHMWNSKAKIWVCARLVKRDDLSVSTSQWSSHVSQRLRNNWVTRGWHTLVYLTAQTPLRMHKTLPDVTLAEEWNNLKHLLSLHWSFLYRAALLRFLQICTRPSATTKLTWIWLWWCHRYVTVIKQRISERGRQEVDTKSPSYLKRNEMILLVYKIR